ncbi:hypothetical protein BFP72_07715 [Reichenbachiella sp. 5M10]|uniref:hypothetical protein n=1 Tax=Reichenbachiella sp. 5M10 TaxID=1889772 RepID=UPI000C15F99C|nr:hypothetical protein [Reichenbachiella sp. 5M10]PIB35292.1 hypothetical protein BFP72_07715 [Reichenbachiella sp. 5M10]
MKKSNLLSLASALLVIFCFGCEGPEGPAGQDGENGLNGDEGYVFEYDLSFSAPEYSALLELPNDFTMLDSDVMVVYLLWEVTNDGTEIWRALPQTLYFDDGILSYNYDYTKYDAELFLDGTVNLDNLGANLTDNWIARVVVLPAQFVNARSRVDYSDYDQVVDYFGLQVSQVTSPDYPSRPE